MNESLALMTRKNTHGMLHHRSSKLCLPRQELIQEQCGWRNAGGPEKFVMIIHFLIIFSPSCRRLPARTRRQVIIRK